MAQQYSLFGPNVSEVEEALPEMYLQQAMMQGQHAPALKGNPFYLPSISAGMMQGGQGIASLFGAQPAELKKAYEMQAIQQEVDSQGIDFAEDPMSYAKLAASAMLKRGYRTEALQAMQWALDSGLKMSEMAKNMSGGRGGDSDREEAQRRVVRWLMNKKAGVETTPDEDIQTQADLEIVEPLKTSDAGELIYAPNSIRRQVEQLMGTPSQQIVQTKPLPPIKEEAGPASAYSEAPYTGGAGEYRVPNPQRKTKELNENVDRILNDVRQKPHVAIVESLDQLEKTLAPFLQTGEPIPGLGFGESWFTMGAGAGGAKAVYSAAAEMGNKNAAQALSVLNALDSLMSIEITRQAGASQTVAEAARQFRAKALTKGTTQEEFLEAFTRFKSVIDSELAAYFGGLDPMVKDRLVRDPEFGGTFQKIFERQPFGVQSGVPKGVPSGAKAIGRDKKTGKVIYEKDGKRYIGDE